MIIIYYGLIQINCKMDIFRIETQIHVVDGGTVGSFMNTDAVFVLQIIEIHQRTGIVGPHIRVISGVTG